MRGNGRREDKHGGKGLGFGSGVAQESGQVLGFSIRLGYRSPKICCRILSVNLKH
jgi:hypothetical protein